MSYLNVTTVTEIFLLGFQDFYNVKTFFFFMLLINYCLTLCGNLLIIQLVSYNKTLHSPMYFFITQLSITDILLSTSIIPNTLNVVIYEGCTMPFTGCLGQFYFYTAVGILECLLLTVMSFDRYQAICHPLTYNSIMTFSFCRNSILLFWLTALIIVSMFAITMSQLQFCGPNVIDHFFCDFYPILDLSCTDTFLIQMESMLLVIPIVICPNIIITVSYVYIVSAILKISSTTGRQKTFSTCSSHLLVVFIYYVSLMNIYLFPNKESAKKVLSLMYTLLIPLLNPIIYSLRNNDIKQAFRKLICKNYETIFKSA
ncbi:olfactory receptor 11L1-like [Lithobates pipiens]